jgi:hypothetical protein
MSDWNRGGRESDRRYGERNRALRDERRAPGRPGRQDEEPRSFDFERDPPDHEYGGYPRSRGFRGEPYPRGRWADEDGREGFDRYGMRGEKDYRGELYRTPTRIRRDEGGAAYSASGGIGINPALERQAFGEADHPWRDEPHSHEGWHRGRGPKNYTRSDERIHEDVSERLSDDSWLDASEIEVAVQGCEVTLAGTVQSRRDKHRAEHLVEAVSGVRHVQNNLRVQHPPAADAPPPLPLASRGRGG